MELGVLPSAVGDYMLESDRPPNDWRTLLAQAQFESKRLRKAAMNPLAR